MGESKRGGGKYCSRECFGKARNLKEQVKCSHCGLEFNVMQYKIKSGSKLFCSNACSARYRIKQRSPDEIAMKKLNGRIGSLMWYSLKGSKNGCKWESLVEYTLEELKNHLESLFKIGMSWENMGKWHVDHKIPRCAFNYTSPEDQEFLRCWSLSNLQPLWAVENLRKGSKIIS